MTLTLLLDLDDTLLRNKIEEFVPYYLQRFSQEVAATIAPEKFVQALWAGTRAMLANRRPDCTLREAFEAVFYPMTDSDPAVFQGLAERFYAEVFPMLEHLTAPNPGAAELVAQARAAGHRLVLATNPLFPRVAILHRLAWAQLGVPPEAFDLITSYETFHFTKNEPAYYAEILGRLGWPSRPVVMVGDDLVGDIQSAQRAGLAGFWVRNGAAEAPAEAITPLASGDLPAALRWLQAVDEEALQPNWQTPSAILASLRAQAAVIDTLCRDRSPEQWTRRPVAGEWNLTEVLCHLRDVDREVNLPRLHRVVEEASPFIVGVDTDAWAQTRNYAGQDGPTAFREFIQVRLELLEFLEGLAPPDWRRDCRHAIFGPTTLLELAGFTVAHDRIHLQQIQALLE